jgi:hypothetical protein
VDRPLRASALEAKRIARMFICCLPTGAAAFGRLRMR